jgi:hypothetical protein
VDISPVPAKNARNLPEIIHRDIHGIPTAQFIGQTIASRLPVRRTHIAIRVNVGWEHCNKVRRVFRLTEVPDPTG